jgi:hypothetical protein
MPRRPRRPLTPTSKSRRARRRRRSTPTNRCCARTRIRFSVPLSSRKRITRQRRRICRSLSTRSPVTRTPWSFSAWRCRWISSKNIRRRSRWPTAPWK